MKLTSLTTPIIGTRRGQVFTAPGDTNLARGRVVPLQPRSNTQVATATAIAAAAQYWKLLDATDRAAWADWFGAGQAAYNAFVQVNANAITWGSSVVVETPYLVVLPGIDFAVLYAEPDGINTTLAISVNGVPSPPNQLWCRLYVNFQQTSFGKNNSSARSVYAGSWGPLTGNTVNLFDFTAWMTALAGQWWYPAAIDTASDTTCGNQCTAQWYATDQFGMPSDFGGPYPVKNQFAGIEPGQLGPGTCPISTTPPFAWPTAAAFYGAGANVNVITITATGGGTYTATPGTKAILVQLVGGGGGGGGVASPGSTTSNIGGGGGGGAFAQKYLSTAFSPCTYSVGAGGAGGPAGNNAGSNGGDTTFTTPTPVTITAGGGQGNGRNGNFTPPFLYAYGIKGGSATGGDINEDGGTGSVPFCLNTANNSGGSGGPSHFSTGTPTNSMGGANSSQAGTAGSGYGGGGSGAVANGSGIARAGGQGSDGLIVIYEFS